MISSRPSTKRGFSFVELLVSVIILSILVGVAIGAFQIFIAKACKITMQHDLRDFIKAEGSYLIDHGHYLGAAGDFIQYGQPPSGTLAVPDFRFTPSEGVRIEITSGSGLNRYGPPTLKATVRHALSNVAYEYDFATGKTTERKN